MQACMRSEFPSCEKYVKKEKDNERVLNLVLVIRIRSPEQTHPHLLSLSLFDVLDSLVDAQKMWLGH